MVIAGNSLLRLGGAVALLLGLLIAARIGRAMLDAVAAKFRDRGQALVVAGICAVSGSLFIVALAIGVRLALAIILLPERFEPWAETAARVLVVTVVVVVVYRLVDVADAWLTGLAARTRSRLDDMLVPLVRKTLKITVVVLGVAQIAQTLSDKPLTSIIASLGIGGLAVALAAQETIKNFFGSLVLLGDKPFELGDRVMVDSLDGVVESLGFRSTRIRTLDGHLVTYPNGELANKVITNVSRRPFIRRILNIGLPYDTPPEKVARAVAILKDLLDQHEGMRPELPPRIFFNDFNAASLNLQIIYWFHPPDYWLFQAFNERVNMEILRRFNDEGIEFAFPTQTLFVASDPRRPFALGNKTAGLA